MEYLVNISKRRALWSLNEDILKITIMNTNTPYPSRKIRRIRACTHQRPQRKQDQYVGEVSPKSKNDMPLRDNGLGYADANEHIEKVLEIVDLFHIPNITIDQVMLRAFLMSLTGAGSRWLRNEPTGAYIKTLEIQIGQMSKVLQERGFGSLPSSTEANPRDQVKLISTTIKADSCPIRQKKGSFGPQFSKAYSEASQSIPRKEKDIGSFTLPCFINNVCFDNALVNFGASVSIIPLSTYLNLGLGELAYIKLTVELADRTVKYPKGIAENMLVSIGKFVFLVEFITLDMPEDIKVPLILGRPFLSTAHAMIGVYKRKITLRVREERIIFTSIKLASSLIKRVYMLSLRERMELDLEARIMGETLLLNRSLNHFFEDSIELNDLNKPFELRRNQEDMDAYRDEGMGDVIFGEPFLREAGIKTRRFERMITIYNGPRKRNIDEYWTMDMTIDQQVAIDEALVPHACRLRIGRNVLEIYMQEFWVTAMVHHHSIRFKMDNKKHIVNLESFREMLHIYPRLHGQPFVEPPFKEEILDFF
nr:hypothetical protein [Tanacetum cinerariifolium]